MKEIIESIKAHLPESSIRIRRLLKDILDEVEFVMEHFIAEGYLPDKLDNIYKELDGITEDMKLGYGQLNLLDGIRRSTSNKDEKPNYKDYEVDNSVPHTLLENFTHIKPYGFKFIKDELIEAKSWKALYIKACEIFLKLDEKKFMSFESRTYMNGETRDYFSKDKENMDLPVKILDKIYISTRFGANEFRDLLIKILKEYNYNVEDFIVYFRADYNPLHYSSNDYYI